ncbi:formate-dependent phosphoribosylglycinamide formyltransferase [Sphingomicrobium sp. XHP0239]|uniref:formate-dependent phosphoribosylglycinamide formyltransferase n=1 Tax=Sphingomicrobium maritimum TaxID=3133972 RepID=UPI0031CC6108
MTPTATVLLLGSGELGKEFVISCQRLGCRVIACDAYEGAPAMQVADAAEVFSMLDGAALRAAVEKHRPDHIVPEIEAIRTEMLVELEGEGWHVVPTAEAARLTMNRDAIRDLAAGELGLATSPYRYAESFEELEAAGAAIGFPLVVKPVMSSSGKGQSIAYRPSDLETSWDYARAGMRGDRVRVIAEGFVDFDYEITLLTVRHQDGVSFCPPVGHRQEQGDYRTSWQPHAMSEAALAMAQAMAKTVVNRLGGHGLFGVEFFVTGDEVIFSELSPRPHDTGMVTLISQNLSEFDLHARAILGLPVPDQIAARPSASAVVLADREAEDFAITGLAEAMDAPPGTQVDVRVFGKPVTRSYRRMGVALVSAPGAGTDRARELAEAAAAKVRIDYAD